MKTRAVIVEVGKIPVVREIEGFEEAKKIIGGHIQRVRMGKYDCLCDEDGGPKGLAPNRFINGDQMICGTFVVTRLKNKGLGPITESEASWLIRDLVEA
jgi:hypothetical protein